MFITIELTLYHIFQTMYFRQYNPLKTDQTYFTVQLSLDKSSWPIFKINSEVGNLCLNFIHLWMEAMPKKNLRIKTEN